MRVLSLSKIQASKPASRRACQLTDWMSGTEIYTVATGGSVCVGGGFKESTAANGMEVIRDVHEASRAISPKIGSEKIMLCQRH